MNMNEQDSKKSYFTEVDLLQLVGKVLSQWKLILKVTLCFMAFGVVMALSSIKKYTAQVVVAPEASTSGMNGGLASLASLAGVDMGGGGDAIYPLLYPDIIRSLPFLCSLLDVHVQSSDGRVDTTYSYYMKGMRKQSWVNKVKNYPKKVIRKFLALFKEKVPEGNFHVFDPYRLSRKQMDMVNALDGSIGVTVDMKTEVITLSFTDQDPQIAAMMVDTKKVRLQERIT